MKNEKVNKGKMYHEYNSNYKPITFSVSRKRVRKTIVDGQETTDKLNKLLKRNI